MGPNPDPAPKDPVDPERVDESLTTDLPTEEDFEAAGLGASEGEGDGDGGNVTPEAEAEAPPTPEVDVDPAVAPEVDADPTVAAEVGADQPAPGSAGARKRAPKKPAKPRRPQAPEAPKLVLSAELKTEARQAAFERLRSKTSRSVEQVAAVLDLLEAGRSIVFLARFRRPQTAGMDERGLRTLRTDWQRLREEEEHRVGMRELLRERGGLSPERSEALQQARSTYAMDDIAAPYLPVTASRAFVARGMGLEGLAEAIRGAAAGSELSALAQPFLKPGGEPATLDAALGGARDILAEEFCLDRGVRDALRELFAREGHLIVSVRPEKKGDVGRHGAVLGNQGPAMRVPALKFLAVRRGERERVLAAAVEPPEERALAVIHGHACPESHPHAGLLRAAAEDGYRRILKPLLQREIREELKLRADQHALETFERTLRNLLLGPVGGTKKTLGIRPDVVMGHRWCAIDASGLPAGSGQLPHEPTAGRPAVLTELKDVLKTYEIEAISVGTTGGKAEALALVREALAGREREVPVVATHDGGVRAVEGLGKLATDDRPDVPPEQRGALSLARRFQDPLAELVTIDPKALALGPHLGDVHQGELRRLLDETITSCVAFAGVDASRASADVLARLPGFDRAKAEAFVKARAEAGPLPTKAALAAVEGIGPEAAEEAVGFLRLPQAADLRDRTQLHPEQYAIVDAMAQQLGLDVQVFCADPENLGKLKLDELVTPEVPKPLLFDVCWQLEEGQRDPRPRFAVPIPPPPGITLATLRPGLMLEGRVTRVAPFGVFVDVGMEIEGLLPVPHIGDRPGVDPAMVAPLGAVIQVRVLEAFPEKRRLALTMRSDARLAPRPERGGDRGGGRGGDRGGDRGPRGPRRPMGAGAPGREPMPVGAPMAGGPPPEAGRRDRGERRGRDDRGGRDGRAPEGRGAGRPRQFSAAGGGGGEREPRPPRKAGGITAIGGAFGGRDPTKDLGLFDRGIKDESGTPRRISLKAEAPAGPDDDKGLTPEQILAKKLADLMAGKKPK